MLPIRPERANVVSDITWNIIICQGTQGKWVQRSFIFYRNIYSFRNNNHRSQAPFILSSHTSQLFAFFPGRECGKGSHMPPLYKTNSLLSPSRPLANLSLWEVRFLECVLAQTFDIRSKYSSPHDSDNVAVFLTQAASESLVYMSV